MIKFFVTLLATTVLIVAGTLLLHATGSILKPSFFIEILIFLFFGTALLYRYLFKAGPSLFIQMYLLTMVVKLIAYLSFVVYIVLEDKEQAYANVVFFLINYFLFTALEIGFLYRKISR